MSLAPGTRFGHYKVSALLGQGGMGTVYRATDTRLNRTVALKIINPELAKSEDYRSRLAQEARRAAAIDSPYVVKVWQYEEVESQPFISLELVSGENLSEAIEGLPKSQLIEIAMKIAKGLDAAHRELVIHRDLKPDNIKLTSSGDPKILDFGLALQSQGDPIDAQGNIEGTILYASPEQLSAEPITAASDLYSYGVILYEMFTGRHPFAGEHPAASMYSILYDDPASPTELVPDLPNWLSSLIVTLLEKQPEDRFPSACEVVEAIEANMESRSSGSTQVTFPQRRRTVTIVDIKNLSADKSWDYFCHGFTEDVITEVSRRTDMVVFGQPATAVSRDIDQAFESFRTDFLVNGSLLQWQETVRLSLNIYSRQDRHLISSKKHEGPSRDIFQLLSQAAEVAAEVLATSCGSQPIETAEAKRPDVTAYDYYLKGKSYYQTNRQEDLVFSIDLYKKALELAPQMAIVHAGLSDVYAFQYMAYYDRSPHRIEFARQQANRALELDPKLPEGHRSLGRCHMFCGDFQQAETAFRRAISHNPKYAVGYRTLAWLKITTGELDEALRWARKSLELAPVDLETLLLISLINMDLRKYTIALATLKRAIELGPDYGRAFYNLGQVYIKLGMAEPALENFLKAIRFQGDPNACIDAGYVYYLQQDYESARRELRSSVEMGQLVFIAEYLLGVVDKTTGDEKSAVQHFRRSISSLDAQLSDVSAEPIQLAYRTLILATMGESAEAEAGVEKLSQIDSFNGETLYCVARTWKVLGDDDKARACLERAMAEHDGPTAKEITLDPLFRSQ